MDLVLKPFIYELGYELIKGYAFRCDECKVGKKNSCHKKCLGEDLELLLNKVYQNSLSNSFEIFKPIGEKWESLHPLCRWGGRFRSKDSNHFSIIHGGMK